MDKKIVFSIWLFIGIGLLISSCVLFIATPEFWKANLLILIGSLSIFVILAHYKKQEIKKIVKSLYFKNLISNSITVLFTFFIILLMNYIGYKNNKYFDLTEKRLHTLSDQSMRIVKLIDKPLKMTLFAKRGEWDHYLSFLKRYEIQSENILVSAKDIDIEPALVKLYQIEKSGSVLLEYNGRKTVVIVNGELDITNKILKLVRGKEINLFYSVGHNESDLLDSSAQGYKYLSQKIKDSTYKLKPLDLLKERKVPSEADGLLILNPKKGFLDLEITKIEDYIKNGGNIIFTLAPEVSEHHLDNLYQLIEKYGVKFSNNIAIDRLASVQGQNATVPIINNYGKHPITEKFQKRTLFPLSSSLIKVPNKNIELLPFVFTSAFPASWGESNINEVLSGKANFDENDIKGPLILAMTSEVINEHAKLVVFGSASFLTNAYQSQSDNFNLFLNSLSWALDDEGIISINRPGLEHERIFISVSQEMLILFFLMICLPTLFFAMAIFMYRRRVNK